MVGLAQFTGISRLPPTKPSTRPCPHRKRAKDKRKWVATDECWGCDKGRQSKGYLPKECLEQKGEIHALWRKSGEALEGWWQASRKASGWGQTGKQGRQARQHDGSGCFRSVRWYSHWTRLLFPIPVFFLLVLLCIPKGGTPVWFFDRCCHKACYTQETTDKSLSVIY